MVWARLGLKWAGGPLVSVAIYSSVIWSYNFASRVFTCVVCDYVYSFLLFRSLVVVLVLGVPCLFSGALTCGNFSACYVYGYWSSWQAVMNTSDISHYWGIGRVVWHTCKYITTMLQFYVYSLLYSILCGYYEWCTGPIRPQRINPLVSPLYTLISRPFLYFVLWWIRSHYLYTHVDVVSCFQQPPPFLVVS